MVVAILLFIALAVLAGGYFGYKYYKNRQNKTAAEITREPGLAKDVLDTGINSEAIAVVVDKYSQKYAEALQNTSDTNPSKWDKAKVDDAYVILLYVSKMGSYAQTLQYLALLESAKRNGINIDDNSYFIDQKIRDDIYIKAEQASGNALEQKGASN